MSIKKKRTNSKSSNKSSNRYKGTKNINIHITSSRSNTIISHTDFNGNVVKQFSCGQYYNSKSKGSDLAVTELIQMSIQWCIDNAIEKYHLIVKGTGIGVNKINKYVSQVSADNKPLNGELMSVSYNTSVQYGGCRKPKPRRG